MNEQLQADSELAAASWLRDPLNPDPVDPLAEWFRIHAEIAAAAQPIRLPKLLGKLDGLYPDEWTAEPQLLEYRDVLWLPDRGCLFHGGNGRALPWTAFSRFPRKRQLPQQSIHRIELSRPVQSFPRLEQALWLPRVNGGVFGEWLTEVLAFLWPLLLKSPQELIGLPVLLGDADLEDPLLAELHRLMRAQHLTPLLNHHLPAALHLERVLVPQPSLRLHAGTSSVWWRSAVALGDHLAAGVEAEPVDKLYLSRTSLPDDQRRIPGEAELEQALEAKGWMIWHPQQQPLQVQVAALRAARVIAGFHGAAWHGLGWIDPEAPKPRLLLLGDRPSLDLMLQLRLQRFEGWHVPCQEATAGQAELLESLLEEAAATSALLG